MDWDPSAPVAARSARPAAEPAPSRQRKAAARRVQARRRRSPRPLSRFPRRRTPPTTRGPVQLKRLPESGRSAQIPTSGATRRRNRCHPSRRRSRNRRTTNLRRPRSRTTPQQCRPPPPMSRGVRVERLGRLRRVGAGRRCSRSSARPRAPAIPAAPSRQRSPSPRPRFPVMPLKLRPRRTRRGGKASTSGCPTARKPKPDGPRLRPGRRHHHLCPGHPERGRRNDRGIGRVRTGRRRTHPGRKAG